MKIHGLVVCVNYSDFLAVGIERWMTGLSSLAVVTDTKDTETAELAQKFGACVAETDLFYADGAIFNKGRAMEWARRRTMMWEDWILFFDADVVPPTDWKARTEQARPRPGFLYSAWRHQCDSPERVDDPNLPKIHGDVIGVGFFQLFHTSDPAVRHASDEPLIDTWWLHGGNYDSRFMHRWPGHKRVALPFHMAHLGERDNWWGRGNKEAFTQMQAERQRRGGWQHERIPATPIDD